MPASRPKAAGQVFDRLTAMAGIQFPANEKGDRPHAQKNEEWVVGFRVHDNWGSVMVLRKGSANVL